MKKYESYTTKDFLNDEFFGQWQLLDSEELNSHWQKVLSLYPHLLPQIEDAKVLFKEYLQLNNYRLEEEKVQSILAQVLENKKPKSKRISLYWKLAMSVASIALIFVISKLWLVNSNIAEPQIVYAQLPVIEQPKEVQLIRGDSTIILQNNVKLTYNNPGLQVCEVIENTLVVPFGKRSTLVLSDGTKVWVNSGTTIIYPSVFADEGARSIFVDGEIYLEVYKDATRPFNVKSAEYEINVLGTSFNISAYSTDAKSSVVLVEGSVQIKTKSETIKIKPNQMYSLVGDKSEIKFVDVANYTSWRNGWLQFDGLPLEELATRLSRHYGIAITCDATIAGLLSSGKLLLPDDIDQLLITISRNMNIEYVHKDNSIRLMNHQ